MDASAARGKDAPWKSIARSLARSGWRSPEGILSARLTAPTVTPASDNMDLHHAKVNVLERTSASTAIISWHDPTRCSYRFQLWRRANSTRSGVCALSAMVINAGDRIYRPITKPPPLNASAMILATEVESRLSYESLEHC
ncbi:DUF3331 domain-containing protein [Paraburkholderia phymatum]|uniref:DUF3331 domain-containing protein n=1 Tax=Paraburkholderia phymatum TaxID=148447 RepID=UPI003D164670